MGRGEEGTGSSRRQNNSSSVNAGGQHQELVGVLVGVSLTGAGTGSLRRIPGSQKRLCLGQWTQSANG